MTSFDSVVERELLGICKQSMLQLGQQLRQYVDQLHKQYNDEDVSLVIAKAALELRSLDLPFNVNLSTVNDSGLDSSWADDFTDTSMDSPMETTSSTSLVKDEVIDNEFNLHWYPSTSSSSAADGGPGGIAPLVMPKSVVHDAVSAVSQPKRPLALGKEKSPEIDQPPVKRRAKKAPKRNSTRQLKPRLIKLEFDDAEEEPETSIRRSSIPNSRTKCLSCPHCDQVFMATTRTPLRNHIERVHQQRDSLQCGQRFCTFVADNEDELDVHLTKRHGIKFGSAMQCKICGQWLKDKRSLKRHELEIHDRDRALKYSCAECEFVAMRSVSLRRHMLAVHNSVLPPLVRVKSEPKTSINT